MTERQDHSLQAKGLVFQIEASRLLDRVDLHARQGELVGLVGPNGAGKSTLLKSISGLLRHQQGVVTLQGRELGRMNPREVARTLGLVHQLQPYTHGFTTLEVVLMGRYPHTHRFQVEGVEDRRIAHEVMRLTETEAFSHREVTTLSGGERQRVFIARALAQEPRILLLDEPTSNLDVQHQLKVLDIVRGLVADGMTAVAALHDLPLAARYCHRLVLLKQGCVVADGPPEEVLTPANMQDVFGVRTVVYRDPLTGSLNLSLMEPAQADRSTGSGRVHVVCGGGSGARLLYELQQAGYTVTAGALGSGDTDRTAADILGIPYVAVPAFSPIDDMAFERHRELVRYADVTVLCETPFGPNNLRNLEAAVRAGRLVRLETTPIEERDFTGGEARRLLAGACAVATCTTVSEVLGVLAHPSSRCIWASPIGPS